MATVIEMGIVVQDGGFPSLTVENNDDARELVRLLTRLGVAVNLRAVSGPVEPPGPGEAGFDYETFAAHTREKYGLAAEGDTR
ncbi:hypothetical protein SEA_MAGRITTE_181 [Microbacterium phage Magritte]|nr:hypothetical protein SEA_MAGRITTE_181 [Microbacterium phage Magritte]